MHDISTRVYVSVYIARARGDHTRNTRVTGRFLVLSRYRSGIPVPEKARSRPVTRVSWCTRRASAALDGRELARAIYKAVLVQTISVQLLR